jgi:hypothetical protein
VALLAPHGAKSHKREAVPPSFLDKVYASPHFFSFVDLSKKFNANGVHFSFSAGRKTRTDFHMPLPNRPGYTIGEQGFTRQEIQGHPLWPLIADELSAWGTPSTGPRAADPELPIGQNPALSRMLIDYLARVRQGKLEVISATILQIGLTLAVCRLRSTSSRGVKSPDTSSNRCSGRSNGPMYNLVDV